MVASDRFFLKIERIIEDENIPEKEKEKIIKSSDLKLINSLANKELSISEKAEELALDAMEILQKDEIFSDDIDEAQKLVFKSLKMDPDCLWAYEPLIWLTFQKPVRMQMIERGIKIGEKKFGGEFEKMWEGEFYQKVSTRPYIRLLNMKLSEHWKILEVTKGIETGEKILRLNPNDNLGARDILQLMYLFSNRLDDFYTIWEKYKDDYSAAHYYNEALYWYMVNGDSEDADIAMLEALEFNPWVIDFLTRKEKLSDYDDDFSAYDPREFEGAIVYSQIALKAWWKVVGIQKWLKSFY